MAQPTTTFTLEESEFNQEVHTFLWTIPQFGILCKSQEKNPDVNKKIAKAEFSTGERSISTKTNWEFFLSVNPNRMDFGWQCLGPRQRSLAKCEVFLKAPSGKFINATTLEQREYSEGETATCNLVKNIKPDDIDKDFLPEDDLQLRIKVTIAHPFRTSEDMQQKTDILKVFEGGLASRVVSDVTFVFEEEGSGNVIEEIRAHKAILSFHSPVFAELFGNERTEGTHTKVKISEMSPQGMKILLQFLYSGEMDEYWKSVVEELIHATQKYQMGLLQKFLGENIGSALTAKNAMKIRNWGEKCGFPEVVATAMKFMKDNFEDLLCFHSLVSKDT